MTSFEDITWTDAAYYEGQHAHDDSSLKTSPIRSLGFFVAETETTIIIARDDCEENQFRGIIAIPTNMILTRKTRRLR